MKSVLALMSGFAAGMVVAIYSPRLRRDIVTFTNKVMNKMEDLESEMISSVSEKIQEPMTSAKQKNRQVGQNNKKDYKNNEK